LFLAARAVYYHRHPQEEFIKGHFKRLFVLQMEGLKP
jgi:hypothetical protein